MASKDESMKIQDLTDRQTKKLQGVCIEYYRTMQRLNPHPLPELDLWKRAFSCGVQATLNMFTKRIHEKK